MCDDATKKLLQEWGFESLIDTIAENDVNEEVFASPQSRGIRVSFMAKLLEFKEQKSNSKVNCIDDRTVVDMQGVSEVNMKILEPLLKYVLRNSTFCSVTDDIGLLNSVSIFIGFKNAEAHPQISNLNNVLAGLLKLTSYQNLYYK